MPVTRLNYFNAKPARTEDLAKFLLGIIDIVKSADGCVSCRLLRDQVAADQFVVLEVWTSVDAHQHAATRVPKEKIAEVMEFLIAPPTGEYLVAR